MIKILAIGKRHEPWVTPGIQRYQQRLRSAWEVEWLLLPHSSLQGIAARVDESSSLLQRIKPTDYVVLLDERGTLLDSPTLSSRLQTAFTHSRPVVCIIGGAYGVDERIHQRADLVWSLSPLVFPHQLVRLILIEQLYRAGEIASGRPYHHE